ncbi:MAG: hypothetical protein JWN70_1838 [Planctomycetaceae bacterium]|nr:hypothetical protein [Planctomycetaceae bacterium]
MGIDERDMLDADVEVLPDRLRAAGFEIAVSCEPYPGFLDLIVVDVRSADGKDTQSFVCIQEQPGQRKIYIANAWSWWPAVQNRRQKLQDDVTAVIDQSGGFSSPG